jgi:hypothetical protein
MSKIVWTFYTCDFAHIADGGVREDDGVPGFDRGNDILPEFIDISKV